MYSQNHSIFQIKQIILFANSPIDPFHIVYAHACIAHVTRYFSIICETLYTYGANSFQAIDTFYVIRNN